jgi:hypothetical protein
MASPALSAARARPSAAPAAPEDSCWPGRSAVGGGGRECGPFAVEPDLRELVSGRDKACYHARVCSRIDDGAYKFGDKPAGLCVWLCRRTNDRRRHVQLLAGDREDDCDRPVLPPLLEEPPAFHGRRPFAPFQHGK